MGRGHGLPQGLDRVQIPLHPIAQVCKTAGVLLAQQAVVVLRQLKLAEEYYLSAKTIYKILASMRQA